MICIFNPNPGSKLLEKSVAKYDVRAWFAGARGFEDVSLCLPCFWITIFGIFHAKVEDTWQYYPPHIHFYFKQNHPINYWSPILNQNPTTANQLVEVFPFSWQSSTIIIVFFFLAFSWWWWLAWCRYLVHANGICAGYSLLSAIFTAMPRPPTMSRAWTFFLLDQVRLMFNVRLKLPHTWKSWHNNMNQIYGVSIHHVGVDILNTGCWSGFNWGGVFGLQGRWSSHMEWCMQLLWGLLPEDHCIHLHHFCYSPLLCCAFPHLLLQTLQQVRRPHLLQWQRHRDSCIS